jgi:GNAT superfamily N-acetyltransferase
VSATAGEAVFRMPDYEVVPYRPELLEPMIALYSEVFSRSTQECRAYLHWKYWRNPYLDEPLLFLAQDGTGSVVGMRGFYGASWQVGGRRVVIPCADDFAIASAERNKGLMTVIMRTALDSLARRGFGYTMNASGGELTVLQSLAMGWKSLGPIEPVARMTRRERARRAIVRVARRTLLGRLVPTRMRYATGSFAELDRHARNASARTTRHVVVECSPRPEAMAQLVHSNSRDARIRHVRDADFFRWRFANPTREYRFLYVERDGALDGFIAVAGYRRSNLQFNIVDIEARNDVVLAELLESACAWGRFPAIGAWSASCSAATRTLLARHGFVPSDRGLRARGMPCVLLKRIGSAESSDVDGAAWDIRLIDSMHG